MLRIRVAFRQAKHSFPVISSIEGCYRQPSHTASARGNLLRNNKVFNYQFNQRHHLSSPNRRSSGVTVMAATVREGEAYCVPRASRMMRSLLETHKGDLVKLEIVTKDGLAAWKESQPEIVQKWLASMQFQGKDGEVCAIPAGDGGVKRFVVGMDDVSDLWAFAALPSKLPPAVYRLSNLPEPTNAALGWILGQYSFDRYKSSKKNGSKNDEPKACLVWPEGADRDTVRALAEGICIARDMITTPAEDMRPQDIAAEMVKLAEVHGARINVISGENLIKEGYPAIHMVGRASENPPHLVDLRWQCGGGGEKDSINFPKVTLVGKGVTFDTGGLDLKPAAAMKLMKKDMGGSALVIALAHAIMSTKLPISLRVLVPTVENSVSGNAYRPLDVLQTRAGLTVENGNTDAEGRLILCDALAEADQEHPDVLIDAATLTGAARVALGTELPALFSNNDSVAQQILDAGLESNDNLWRLPLHRPYRKMLDSKVADIYSCSEGGYAGAITAALFLQEFIKNTKAWVHIDTMGYNTSSKPGRPEGGEAFALRALYRFICTQYVMRK